MPSVSLRRLLAALAFLVSAGNLLPLPHLRAVFPLADTICQNARTSRDWTKAPAILELDTPEDIYAIGDVHGDYERLVTLLIRGKLISAQPENPEDVHWSAGRSILVCTGDLIDKGAHSLKVIALFRALAVDAAKSKGRVVVLMGNHEAEFMADPDDDDKAQEFIKELNKHSLKPQDVAACRDEKGIGEYLNSLPLAARINDCFFAHAGDTQGLTLKDLRHAIEEDVTKNGYKAEVLVGSKGLLEARLHKHPWWEKKDDAAGKGEVRLRRYVEALGVKHLIIGHQPGNVSFADGSSRKKGTLVQKFDGLIFLIDVGMSEAIDYSRGAILHIRNGGTPQAVVECPDKETLTIWP